MFKNEFEVSIEPRLNQYDKIYLLNFNITPKYKRSVDILIREYQGRNGYNGTYGVDGEFFIYHRINSFGQYLSKKNEIDPVVSYDKLASNLPSVWCPWKPNIEGDKLIVRNNSSNDYLYDWLIWLMRNILNVKYKVNGTIKYEKDNNIVEVKITDNRISYKLSNKEIEIKPKTDTEIINNLIELTNNNELKWTKDDQYMIVKYDSKIKVKGNIFLDLNLYVKNPNKINVSNYSDYLNIYIIKNGKTKLYRNIRNYKVNELVKFVLKNKNNININVQ